ncbi:MAG: TerC family protein [Acidobacteria bacterium]|nr:TerC family protein [Acidobacteriota bacterium]
MDWIGDPQGWIALATLTALEIVLGIDNVIFISILASRLPAAQQPRARRLGLLAALISRLMLLFSLTWIMRLTAPLFGVAGQEISGRDLILLIGGLFLIGKATREIHHKLEGAEGDADSTVKASFASVILQVLLVDVVFSLDSVITAVGMVDRISIMVAAVLISVGFMLAFAAPISGFVQKHPTVKVLALAFLILIGFTLVAEGFGQHISKGSVYFAMAFSVAVEMLNLRLRAKQAPVQLRERYTAAHAAEEAR